MRKQGSIIFYNKSITVFSLKLKISEIAGPNKLYFSVKLYKCLRMTLVYYSDLPEARDEATI